MKIEGYILIALILILTAVISVLAYKKNKRDQKSCIFVKKTSKIQRLNEGTIRQEIDMSDLDYEAKIAELEKFTETFLSTVEYPSGFENFIKSYSDQGHLSVLDEHLGFEFIAFDRLKEENIEIIVTTNDYYTQFRKIVFFAWDESGHVQMFLDYGKNEQVPSVKILDNELDEIEWVADSFENFLLKIDNKLKSVND